MTEQEKIFELEKKMHDHYLELREQYERAKEENNEEKMKQLYAEILEVRKELRFGFGFSHLTSK